MLIYTQKQQLGGGVSHSAVWFQYILVYHVTIIYPSRKNINRFCENVINFPKFAQFLVKSEFSSQSVDSDTNSTSVFRFQFGFKFLNLGHQNSDLDSDSLKIRIPIGFEFRYQLNSPSLLITFQNPKLLLQLLYTPEFHFLSQHYIENQQQQLLLKIPAGPTHLTNGIKCPRTLQTQKENLVLEIQRQWVNLNSNSNTLVPPTESDS